MFIVKVPGINGQGKTKGYEKAGNAVLNALKEIHSNESGFLINSQKLDIEEIHLDNSDLKLTNKLIYKNSFDIFETKPKTVFLGGDHFISYSLCRAFLDYCQNSGKEPCLIVFDSHPGCVDSAGKPEHESWLRVLVDEGFPPENILLVGIRNSTFSESEFVLNKKIKVISMNQLLLNLEDSCDAIMEFSNKKELYISINLSIIDPAFAPGADYRAEPGGLSSREFIYLIQRINKIKNLRSVDIVGINPEKDINGNTVKLGAKILSEFL